jgi:methionyl-tRNA formyltransferase
MPVILLASDYVGLKIAEYLVGRREKIAALVLDAKDRHGYNQRIQQVYQSSGGGGVIAQADQLDDAGFVEKLAATKPRIGILAWWPHLLKGRILTLPELGWVNIHPSYLPFNRGKHPNFWCLADETPCGVSLHYIDAGVDTGDVIAQKRLDISWEDTGETLYYRLRDLAVDLFQDKYDDIVTDTLPRHRQDEAAGSAHRADEMDRLSRIDLDGTYTARRLFNIIRARMFPPYPTAYFQTGHKKYSVRILIKEIREE